MYNAIIKYFSKYATRIEVLLASILLVLIAGGFALGSYWLSQEGPLRPDPGRHFIHYGDMQPVNEVVQGDTIFVYREYCLTYSNEGLIHRHFENDVVVVLPVTSARGNKGCFKTSFPLVIPESVHGDVIYKTKRIARLNPLKTVHEDMPHISFYVHRKQEGDDGS